MLRAYSCFTLERLLGADMVHGIESSLYVCNLCLFYFLKCFNSWIFISLCPLTFYPMESQFYFHCQYTPVYIFSSLYLLETLDQLLVNICEYQSLFIFSFCMVTYCELQNCYFLFFNWKKILFYKHKNFLYSNVLALCWFFIYFCKKCCNKQNDYNFFLYIFLYFLCNTFSQVTWYVLLYFRGVLQGCIKIGVSWSFVAYSNS